MSHATSAGSASAKWKHTWLQPPSHLTEFLIKILSEKPTFHQKQNEKPTFHTFWLSTPCEIGRR